MLLIVFVPGHEAKVHAAGSRSSREWGIDEPFGAMAMNEKGAKGKLMTQTSNWTAAWFLSYTVCPKASIRLRSVLISPVGFKRSLSLGMPLPGT